MGLAAKASGMVPYPAYGHAGRIDALLLSADHPFAHSSLRKTLAVQIVGEPGADDVLSKPPTKSLNVYSWESS